MDSEGLEMIAFGVIGCLMFGAFWLAAYAFDSWRPFFVDNCFEALDSFWEPVLDACRRHIAVKAKRCSVGRKGGE